MVWELIQRPDVFIAHLAGMQVPMAEARRLAQNSDACYYCRQNFGGHTRANISRRPFLRTRQCSAPVRAAYKSSRRAPAMDI
jgi:hypothetical protein